MTLLELRTKFIQLSGRYDLVVDAVDYVDNGANFYLNQGFRMLDRLLGLQATKAKLYYSIESGDYSVKFQSGCRSITDVWVNSDAKRVKMTKMTLDEFKEYFNGLASASSGPPLYYCLSELRALETTDKDALGTFINEVTAEDGIVYDYRGILLGPPADTDYVVEVSGYFKSAMITTDTDENYWTVEEEGLALRAALYQLESYGRGTESRKQWMDDITLDVYEINKDIVEEESSGVTVTIG